eukprot:scaffold2923_cov313-Pinguiococcus_pyrenoidosus.AAC.22
MCRWQSGLERTLPQGGGCRRGGRHRGGNAARSAAALRKALGLLLTDSGQLFYAARTSWREMRTNRYAAKPPE